MRLHDFILTNREQILIEWETFANTCTPASNTMDVEALRDHADEVLMAIAADLKTYQGEYQHSEKSKGHAPDGDESGLTAAEEHGAERADSGFTALAILGHDLRNPLGAILMSVELMSDTGEMDQTLTMQISEWAMRATQMVGDLLDFTRGRLGGGIPIIRAELDLRKVVHEVVNEIMAAHPERKIEADKGKAQIGQWDAARISQALTNLVGNAVEHSAPGTTVRVELDGGEKDVTIMIHNRGTAIPADRLKGIFNPMKLTATPQKPSTHGPTGNLGLGLYIAERIVHAHAGRIEAESSEGGGTTFTVHLPRGD